ncbi:MAG: helix-turn-helix domain-containing protein [Legionellaceae bacterium]|nr:helix-turn-helix domain-containing protein [Legionellaceae bacterium]
MTRHFGYLYCFRRAFSCRCHHGSTHLDILPTGTRPRAAQAIRLHLGDVILTTRENECLELTIKGFTAKEIAKKLSISPRTVEEYLNQVKLKMRVSSKQQLIQKVLRA